MRRTNDPFNIEKKFMDLPNKPAPKPRELTDYEKHLDQEAEDEYLSLRPRSVGDGYAPEPDLIWGTDQFRS